MSSTYPVITSRPIQPHIATKCPKCSVQLEFPVPRPDPQPGTILVVRCFQCQGLLKYPFQSANNSVGSSSVSGSSTPPPQPKRGRKIGTQENPLETGYYDTLGVPVNATEDDIKKAYRRLAIKHHPDKNRDDPHAEERFKEIAVAYQTLSDPVLRKKYNEFGPKESAPDGGFVDPEEVFSTIFGGDRFIPIIGEISLGRDMKVALQEAEDLDEDGKERPKDAKGKEILTPEEKAKKDEKARQLSAEKAAAREVRVKKLVENLELKLSIFTESATGPNDKEVTESWRTICNLEADDLKKESYGIELLHAVGFVYSSKARHYLASSQTFLGMGGWLHNVQGKYHVFSETMSTLKAAIELKSVFDQIQAAEKAGNLSPEEKKRLEEQAAEKGLQALFKGTKLEVESVLRETCDRVLGNPNVPPQKLHLRAVALQILGDAYSGVKKDGEPGDNEFVFVGTNKSRERESKGHSPSASFSSSNTPKSPSSGAFPYAPREHRSSPSSGSSPHVLREQRNPRGYDT